MHRLPREAWCYPPLHRVQCLCQEEDLCSQEWHESRCRKRLWFLWALGNTSQRPVTRLFQVTSLLPWLLWGSGEERGWLSTSKEAGGEVDGLHGQPGESGPGGGDEQAGWRQGWGSQLGDLTGEWRKISPGFFKMLFVISFCSWQSSCHLGWPFLAGIVVLLCWCSFVRAITSHD